MRDDVAADAEGWLLGSLWCSGNS